MTLRFACRFLLAASIAAPLAAQLPLADLPRVARERAERTRPGQLKALEPYLPDLALDYRMNEQFLEKRIAEVSALGDGLVPLLLEKLTPPTQNNASRQLAENCRRVLERLDPSSFVDALAELANGPHEVGRLQAIRLLGIASSPQAVQVLASLVDRVSNDDLKQVLRSLRLQHAPVDSPRIAEALSSNDRALREEALAYLVDTHPPKLADAVIAALAHEQETRLLPQYVEYFANAVRSHDAAARALLPLLDRERLDWQDTLRLLQVLATIAPANHDPTCRKMLEIVDSGEPSMIAVHAALTLRALGDRQGVTKVNRALTDQLRKPQRRRDSALYELRANMAFAIEEYGDAADDYEKIIEFNDGPAMVHRAYVGLIRCEAHRRKLSNLTKAMKNSGLPVAEIEALGEDDPVVRDALQHDKVRSFLRALAKEQEPK
jgi:tetratricopeptide (TPR) repeat protein